MKLAASFAVESSSLALSDAEAKKWRDSRDPRGRVDSLGLEVELTE